MVKWFDLCSVGCKLSSGVRFQPCIPFLVLSLSLCSLLPSVRLSTTPWRTMAFDHLTRPFSVPPHPGLLVPLPLLRNLMTPVRGRVRVRERRC